MGTLGAGAGYRAELGGGARLAQRPQLGVLEVGLCSGLQGEKARVSRALSLPPSTLELP